MKCLFSKWAFFQVPNNLRRGGVNSIYQQDELPRIAASEGNIFYCTGQLKLQQQKEKYQVTAK